MPHPVGKPSLWRASDYWRYSAATRDGIMVADRAREQWLPSIVTRKRAYRFEGLIPVGVPLGFLLSKLLMNMKKATDRFVRDSIGGCYCAQRFLLLHHTLHHHRPVFSGNSVLRVFRPRSSVLDKRRIASLTDVIFCQKVLDLEIEFARRSKEEV